jgi:hypothetical protein
LDVGTGVGIGEEIQENGIIFRNFQGGQGVSTTEPTTPERQRLDFSRDAFKVTHARLNEKRTISSLDHKKHRTTRGNLNTNLKVSSNGSKHRLRAVGRPTVIGPTSFEDGPAVEETAHPAMNPNALLTQLKPTKITSNEASAMDRKTTTFAKPLDVSSKETLHDKRTMTSTTVFKLKKRARTM